jgi:hypothetical protein
VPTISSELKIQQALTLTSSDVQLWWEGVEAEAANLAQDHVVDYDDFITQLKQRWEGSTLQVKALHELRTLRQHQMSVAELSSKLEAIRRNLPAPIDDVFMADQFLTNLNWVIGDQLRGDDRLTYKAAVAAALKVEQDLTRVKQNKKKADSETTTTGFKRQKVTSLSWPKHKSKFKFISGGKSNGKRDKNQFKGNGKRDKKDITCFHCQEKGHYANECPSKN